MIINTPEKLFLQNVASKFTKLLQWHKYNRQNCISFPNFREISYPAVPKSFISTNNFEEPNIELLILETQKRLSDVCNESQLTPGVLALIIANLLIVIKS